MQPDYFYGEFLRWSFGFENPNKAAALFACLVPMFFALVFASAQSRRGWVRWIGAVFCALAFLVTAVCLALTVSRGGLVAAGCGVLYVAGVYGISLIRRRAQPCWRGVILGVAMLLLAAVPMIWSGLGARSVEVEGDASVGNRLVLWKAGLHMAVDRPAGVGPGQSGAEYMQWYQPVEMSAGYRTMVNSPLTVLVEFGWGWTMAALFCAILFWIWSGPQLRRMENGGAHTWWVAGLQSVLVAFVVAGLFSTTWEEWVLWTPVAVAVIGLGGLALQAGRHRENWLPWLGWAAVLTMACGAALYFAGIQIRAGDPIVRQFADESILLRHRDAPSAEAQVAILPCPAVMGEDSGKLIRQLVEEDKLAVHVLDGWQNRMEKVVVVVAGRQAGEMGDRFAETEILLHPAEVPSEQLNLLKSDDRRLKILVPGLDEDGRGGFWEAAAEDEKLWEVERMEGVGVRVDWEWSEVRRLLVEAVILQD